MKKFLLIAFSGFALLLASCGGNNGQYPQQQNRVSVSPMSNDVNIQADQSNTSFDVNALSTIVQKSTDPKVLEQQINDPSTNINNMDLDKDGKVDYLTVTETGNNELQVNDAAVNPPVLVAKMTITPDNSNQTASLQIQGTPAYCGPYYDYYQPHISFGTMLLMAYLLRPHPYYMPMYGYGHYPSYYTSRRTVVRTVYRPAPSQYSRGSNSSFSHQSGARSARPSLSAPTSSQRSFGVRNTSKPVGTGGFGNSRSSGSSSRSFSTGSRRSFGRRR